MAVHPHFLTYEKIPGDWHQISGWHRWEVWQEHGLHGKGHVYKDLFPLNENIGQGQKIAMEWHGDEAMRIINALWRLRKYPYKDTYWFWPGPNSNTFITWVLDKANVEMSFPWRAWGSSY